MELIVNEKGALTGWYQNNAGNVTGRFPLVGVINQRPANAVVPTTLGWSVAWRTDSTDFHSTTSWTGQWTADDRIVTGWILATRVDKPSELWRQLHMGMDEFHIVGPATA
jgi:hypothetical protein